MPRRLLKPVKYVWDQGAQIASGIRSLVSYAFLSDLIPDWFLRITVEAIPKAIAGETPREQIEGSLILIGWSIATSLFTGLLKVGFVFFWGLFLFIGIVRFSDLGSATWDKGTSLLTLSLPGRDGDGSYGRRRRGR